ncbi:MAG: chromate resistance protein [Chloroflexota bacterium]|nr:chromate resistance protein [Chloroflexota bacterium]
MGTWITRKNLHVDRTACPWLIRRFVDPRAKFVFVEAKAPPRSVGRTFDMLEAEFTHAGPKCTFEVMIERLELADDPALIEMGLIVRGADLPAGRRLRPESVGLEALIDGIQATTPDDDEKLRLTGPLYEALYAYCQKKVRGHKSRDPRRPALRVGRRVRDHLAE